MKERTLTLTIESPDTLNHDPVTDERIIKAINTALGGSAMLRIVPGTLRVMDAPQATLQALKTATDEICREAYEKRGEIQDAVNWADLRCWSAEFSIDDEGDESYRVVIEEASPDCRKFREFVSTRLEARGFKDVEVETEW
jgi:hypothetical protein